MLTCGYIVLDNVDIAYMRACDNGECHDGMVSDNVLNQNGHSARGLCGGLHAEALASAPEL